jgi:NTP pyrophosphatase (non-canonical NTP hydrolase)
MTMPTNLTVKEAQQKVDDWIQSIGQRYFDEMTNTAVLMEEVGELARYMSRIYGEQSFKDHRTQDQAHQAMADEMADVLFVLIALANQTGVDLTAAFEASLAKKTRRDADRHRANPKLNRPARKTEQSE